ncbi:DUF2235 domain-containing protein [Falsiroseomonas sp.]|uniref:DUF2235 domain-containing protein n=1 Tax=Falsiroseomonas sp. TaxID=2870721 RepID=UPI0027162183|nr:DUF2235 domain-containing protein [Falsiroseomonas sp.]MDO9500714.1 DUF2235 domain-containing protein [Falsiroseomonas sp.]
MVTAKRLVVCFDGTWNSADAERSETNVARLARAVRANSGRDGIRQITLYLRGVGSTGIALQRLVGGAFGEGVDDNIRSGYMFLVQNYVPGDEIFLFGFSRGAFSARSLSGLIGSCGLLKRQKLADLRAAWNYYRTASPRCPKDFCARHDSECHTEVKIAFLGVWDTVGALGVPATLRNSLFAAPYRFHDTEPSKIVLRGRHALAIDERRSSFVPTLWTGEQPPGCDIRQVWFAGAHSDVGGGYTNRLLAEIPLLWMAEEAQAAGLQLDSSMLPPATCGTLNPLAAQHESRPRLTRWLPPRFREVLQRAPALGTWERLSRPRDQHGRALQPINESLHPSVAARFGRTVARLDGNKDKAGREITYRPKNLVPSLP